MTPNLYSSRHDLIDNSQMDSTPLNDKLSFLGPDEPSWDTYLKGFGSNGKDRDSGLVSTQTLEYVIKTHLTLT